jgi:hypothetical protein
MGINIVATSVIICLFVACCVLFFHSRDQSKKIREKNIHISALEKLVNQLMPVEPCMTVSSQSGIYCLKPATHYYAGVPICSKCAEEFISYGANPPPFPIPASKTVH